jgi:heat shock protein HslJ
MIFEQLKTKIMRYTLSTLLLIFLVSCASLKKNQFVYWVNSAKVPCEGVGEMGCLKVQKADVLDYSNWNLFYSSIEGFDYQPGYIYKLIVHEEKLNTKNMPEDASSIKYSLVKVIKKEQDLRLQINDIWIVETIEGSAIDITDKIRKRPQIEFQVAEMRVMGNDGCNNFFGSIKVLDPKRIGLGPIAGTKKACMGTNIPDQFNKALDKISAYKVNKGHLLFFDAAGTQLMTLRRID